MKCSVAGRLLFTLACAVSISASAAEGFDFRIDPVGRNPAAQVRQACIKGIETTYGSKVARVRSQLMKPDFDLAWVRVEATLQSGLHCICSGSPHYPWGGDDISGSCDEQR